MNRFIALIVAALAAGGAASHNVRPDPSAARDVRLIGRWDIPVPPPTGTAPSWLEIDSSGSEALVGRITGIVGSARPITEIITAGDSLRFAVPRQWENGNGQLRVVGRLQGNRLVVRMTFPDNSTLKLQGVRAPLLVRAHAPSWSAPITIVDR